ncbi:hypothetical protein [Alteromonas sp. CYL-A6]|uniref:hypothetical protein n=1 Tax=Alteromonas nitratireducens TaxID=3390813 RepID=UPI0034B0E082
MAIFCEIFESYTSTIVDHITWIRHAADETSQYEEVLKAAKNYVKRQLDEHGVQTELSVMPGVDRKGDHVSTFLFCPPLGNASHELIAHRAAASLAAFLQRLSSEFQAGKDKRIRIIEQDLLETSDDADNHFITTNSRAEYALAKTLLASLQKLPEPLVMKLPNCQIEFFPLPVEKAVQKNEVMTVVAYISVPCWLLGCVNIFVPAHGSFRQKKERQVKFDLSITETLDSIGNKRCSAVIVVEVTITLKCNRRTIKYKNIKDVKSINKDDSYQQRFDF